MLGDPAPERKRFSRQQRGHRWTQMTRRVTPLVPTVRCKPTREGSRPDPGLPADCADSADDTHCQTRAAETECPRDLSMGLAPLRQSAVENPSESSPESSLGSSLESSPESSFESLFKSLLESSFQSIAQLKARRKARFKARSEARLKARVKAQFKARFKPRSMPRLKATQGAVPPPWGGRENCGSGCAQPLHIDLTSPWPWSHSAGCRRNRLASRCRTRNSHRDCGVHFVTQCHVQPQIQRAVQGRTQLAAECAGQAGARCATRRAIHCRIDRGVEVRTGCSPEFLSRGAIDGRA
jgi:hypothetical protein